MRFTNSLNILQQHLSKTLPGEAAQYKMAPMKRKSRVEKYSQLEDVKQSAVLLLLFPKNDNTQITLIRRAIDNSHHSGQIALPGGAQEAHDNDLKQTALRETHEEIGIKITDIKVIGSLSELFIPVSKYWVHPFIGYTGEMPRFKPDKSEVDEVLTYELNYFLDPSIIKKSEFDTKSGFKITAPYYELKKDKLWGATAMIMSEFLEIIKEK